MLLSQILIRVNICQFTRLPYFIKFLHHQLQPTEILFFGLCADQMDILEHTVIISLELCNLDCSLPADLLYIYYKIYILRQYILLQECGYKPPTLKNFPSKYMLSQHISRRLAICTCGSLLRYMYNKSCLNNLFLP